MGCSDERRLFPQTIYTVRVKFKRLKGHYHGDFAVFFVNTAQIFDKEPFSSMKLLLEHWGENTKGFLRERTNNNQFLVTSLQYTCRT